MTINVHNHGPNEGRGLDCGEPSLADGSFIGWCQILPIIRKAQEQAWDEAIASLCYSDGTPVEVIANTNPYRNTRDTK